MKDIAVIDIETTGLDFENDYVIEIAIVKVDLDNQNKEIIYNKLIKEEGFEEKFKESWISDKGIINISEFNNAPYLDNVFNEIQDFFNDHYVTSYNKEFDLKFLRKRGFSFPKEFPCIMIISAIQMKIPGPYDDYKWPKLSEAYNFLFSNQNYKEKHRAAADALDASKILIELYNKNEFVEFRMSNELSEVYNKYTETEVNTSNVHNGFEHYPRNGDEALYYLKTKFPLHYAKVRKVIKILDCLPNACGNISIIDFGCGPFTFTFGILDHILERASYYGGGIFNIDIMGLDKSYDALTLGSRLMNSYREKIKYRGFSTSVKINYDDGNFDDVSSNIKDWIDSQSGRYIIMGYSASMSSGIFNFEHIINNLSKFLKKRSFTSIIIEPERYSPNLDIRALKCKFNSFIFKKKTFETSCKKPSNMILKYDSIYSNFNSYIFQNFNKKLVEIIKSSIILESRDEMFLLFNKVKIWLLYERLVDYIGIFLIEKDLIRTNYYLNKYLIQMKETKFLSYKIQKGLSPQKYRDLYIINFPYSFLSFIIIILYGKKWDEMLDDNIYCSRICKKERLNRIYKFFTIGWTSYSNYEIKEEFKNKYICKADIKNYYASINRENLKGNLSNLINETSKIDSFIEIILNCLGDMSGIPIGSALSSLIGNLYLMNFDHKIQNHPLILEYARYMDDLKMILKESYKMEKKKDIESYIATHLDILGLEINEKKFEIKKINRDDSIYKYNKYFSSFTEEYFELINPIKVALSILTYSAKKRKIDLKLLKKSASLISILLEENYITFKSEYLYRYLLLINHKLKDKDFQDMVKIYIQDENKKLHFDDVILKRDFSINKEYRKNFIRENLNWFKNCYNFGKKMYIRLKKEIYKWKDIIKDMKKFNEKNNDEKKDIIKEKNKILNSREFKLSIRMIKYLTYRLTKIKFFKLRNSDNRTIENLIIMIDLHFPIKLIGFILYRYKHIEKLKNLLELSMVRLIGSDESIQRKIYPNDISFLIHLLSLYYDKNKENLWEHFEFWLRKIDQILISRPYEEKMAITEFILRLNLASKISYQKWLTWYEQADNLIVLKNILLCLACHDDSPDIIPGDLREKILEYYSYDELIMNLVLRYWYRIKNKEIKIPDYLFKDKEIFLKVKNFPENIDLDYELRSIFDWDDGFGGNFYY